MMKLVIFVVACMILGANCLREVCDEDKDCNQKNNERCQKYDACKKGYCVCKEKYSTWRQSGVSTPTGLSGVCLPVIKVGSACHNDTKGTCGAGAICGQSTCACSNEFFTKTSDGYHCKPISSALSLDAGKSCVSTLLVPMRCSGGSNCIATVCKCPDGSSWHSSMKLCLHDKSEIDLEEGERCTRGFQAYSEYSTSFAGSPDQICKTNMDCSVCPEETYKAGFSNRKSTCMKDSFSSARAVGFNVIMLLFALSAAFHAV